jgi:hypothetical protein
MLRTTNGKYAGRGPKCGTTSRMEGEVMPCTVTVGWPWSAAGRRPCVGRWWTQALYVIRYDNRDTGISTSYTPRPAAHSVDLAEDAVGILDVCGIERAHAHAWGISMGGITNQQRDQPSRPPPHRSHHELDTGPEGHRRRGDCRRRHA